MAGITLELDANDRYFRHTDHLRLADDDRYTATDRP